MPTPVRARRLVANRVVTGRQAPGFSVAAVVRGFAVAVGLIVVLTFILAMVLRWSPVSEARLPVMGGGIALLSAFIGGAVAGRAAASSGWLHGGTAGLLLGLLAALLGATLGGEGFLALATVVRAGLGLGAGMAGGVFGVNL